jgi:hypothetical protein
MFRTKIGEIPEGKHVKWPSSRRLGQPLKKSIDADRGHRMEKLLSLCALIKMSIHIDLRINSRNCSQFTSSHLFHSAISSLTLQLYVLKPTKQIHSLFPLRSLSLNLRLKQPIRSSKALNSQNKWPKAGAHANLHSDTFWSAKSTDSLSITMTRHRLRGGQRVNLSSHRNHYRRHRLRFDFVGCTSSRRRTAYSENHLSECQLVAWTSLRGWNRVFKLASNWQWLGLTDARAVNVE